MQHQIQPIQRILSKRISGLQTRLSKEFSKRNSARIQQTFQIVNARTANILLNRQNPPRANSGGERERFLRMPGLRSVPG